ncbi:MAG TPA: LytR C-terminal domain-containing protein [Mycobacteriales bacterium]|nr:LytR C-terminal domain-containing protein [Mycobacteriales bacterium]
MTSPGSPEPAAPARPTSHRKRHPVAEALRRTAPPLVAVSAVAVVILLLLVLNSRPTPAGPAPGAVAAPTSVPTSAALTSPPIPTSPAPSSTAPTSAAQSPVSAPPVSQPPATQQPVAARPPVTVLNNSRRQGLAAHVAAQVRAAGWPVRRTGNFTGRIAETTLYYAPGQRAAAHDLAAAMSQIRRVLPRFAGLPGTGLTLVVTRDWST